MLLCSERPDTTQLFVTIPPGKSATRNEHMDATYSKLFYFHLSVCLSVCQSVPLFLPIYLSLSFTLTLSLYLTHKLLYRRHGQCTLSQKELSLHAHSTIYLFIYFFNVTDFYLFMYMYACMEPNLQNSQTRHCIQSCIKFNDSSYMYVI